MSAGLPCKDMTVALVEPDPSLRRLMVLGLQHNDLSVMEANSLEKLVATLDAQDSMPDILIVDIDSAQDGDTSLPNTLSTHARWSTLPIIALSWKLPVSQRTPSLSFFPEHMAAGSPLEPVQNETRVHYVNKPFDARMLFDLVQRLVSEHRAVQAAQQAAALAQAEARLLASYPAQHSTSIWPLVTAMGLFCIVVGFLVQFMIVLIGIVMVVVALLLWTLGSSGGTTRSAVLQVGGPQ